MSLAGLGSPHVANCALPATFLFPLSKVHTLILSESFILQRNEAMLRELVNVCEIKLNKLEPYKSCPSQVAYLLKNIPAYIRTLALEGWKTNQPLTEDCYLNASTLMPLRGARLSGLSFRYSDKILGDRLTAEVFEGIL